MSKTEQEYKVNDYGIVGHEVCEIGTELTEGRALQCKKWIKEKCWACSTGRGGEGAYWLKHVMHRDIGLYVTLDDFIACAQTEGYEMMPYKEGTALNMKLRTKKNRRHWERKQ